MARKTTSLAFLVCAAACLFAGAATAQEQPEMAAAMEAMQKAMTPGPEHAHLAEMVGEFKATLKMWSVPGAPPTVSEGKSVRKMVLGGRVLHEDYTNNLMGMPMTGIGHTGYDNVTGKYWGTWSDNLSTGVSILEGTLDMKTGTGTMEGMTSQPMTGGKIKMRIEMRSEDGKEINDFYFEGPDGEMFKSMEITYERM